MRIWNVICIVQSVSKSIGNKYAQVVTGSNFFYGVAIILIVADQLFNLAENSLRLSSFNYFVEII